jgi:hypothetical protein
MELLFYSLTEKRGLVPSRVQGKTIYRTWFNGEEEVARTMENRQW